MENNSSRPLIFISNDDGYNFPGLRALIGVAREFGDVVAVAPMQHQSAKASSITILAPLRAFVLEKGEGFILYGVNGTPADCGNLGLGALVPRKPDLVLAGVNHGLNHGNSVIYSGTMGVAFEGLMAGVQSVAFSYGDYSPRAEFAACLPILRRVIKHVLSNPLPKDVCLNVNIPKSDEPLKGIKVAVTAPGAWTNNWERRTDPHGMDYYWMKGEYVEERPDDDTTDVYWLKRGWVTITPVHIDQTDYASVASLSEQFNATLTDC